jgi:hypothetical protein
MNTEARAHLKPVLDAESFQRLLAAAFILQTHEETHHTTRASNPSISTIAVLGHKQGPFPQPHTPSLRRSSLRRDRFMPVEFTGLMHWKTVEALAIGMVFCVMLGMSIHRVSASPGDSSLQSEQRFIESRVLLQNKVLTLPIESSATSNPRQLVKADAIAKNYVIRYSGRDGGLKDNQAARKLNESSLPSSHLRVEKTTLRPTVQFTFGTNTDEIAADTVVRYGANFALPDLQDKKKP